MARSHAEVLAEELGRDLPAEEPTDHAVELREGPGIGFGEGEPASEEEDG